MATVLDSTGLEQGPSDYGKFKFESSQLSYVNTCVLTDLESLFSLVKCSDICLDNHVCGTVLSIVERLYPSGNYDDVRKGQK